MERTKRGLITHELTSIIIIMHNIERKIKGKELEKGIKIELNKIDKAVNNIDKINKEV